MTRRSRLILVRHGHTANVHGGGLIDAAGFQAWRDDTDVAGIADHSHPSPSLVQRVARADLLIASDLRRAVESASRLAPGRPIEISPLFHEMNWEVPRWLPLRWPKRFWQTVGGVQWLYRITRKTDASPSQLAQVAAAADLLRDRARTNDFIVVVCHRYVRRLIGRRLEQDGWTREPGRHSYANWSAWEYSLEI